MKPLKKNLSLILSASALLLLSACGGSSDVPVYEPPAPVPPPAPQPSGGPVLGMYGGAVMDESGKDTGYTAHTLLLADGTMWMYYGYENKKPPPPADDGEGRAEGSKAEAPALELPFTFSGMVRGKWAATDASTWKTSSATQLGAGNVIKPASISSSSFTASTMDVKLDTFTVPVKNAKWTNVPSVFSGGPIGIYNVNAKPDLKVFDDAAVPEPTDWALVASDPSLGPTLMPADKKQAGILLTHNEADGVVTGEVAASFGAKDVCTMKMVFKPAVGVAGNLYTVDVSYSAYTPPDKGDGSVQVAPACSKLAIKQSGIAQAVESDFTRTMMISATTADNKSPILMLGASEKPID